MASKPKPKAVSDDLKTYNYRSIPALALYIDRIGAEQLSFNRFMVKEYRGKYYVERCTIVIGEDGEITLPKGKKEYAPTKAEADQIKGAMIGHKWPKAIGARSIDPFIKASGAKRDDLFEFWDRASGLITMVQERRQFKQSGDKAYLPWTMFDDGEVRMMEPSGGLPFWKPKERQSNKIMIHEGAKTARHVDWMINSNDVDAEKLRKTHPWYDELKDWEHWGQIGGALASHRANFEEIRREKPTHVSYICDNDRPGVAALPEVSRMYGGVLIGLKFDDKWPESFDLADEFTKKTCPKMFGQSGVYKGPRMEHCFYNATWATRLVAPTEGAGRPFPVANPAYLETVWSCVRPAVFIFRIRPDHMYTNDELNNLARPFSDADDTARLLRADETGKGMVLDYDPSRPSGVKQTGSNTYSINTHVPTSVRPVKGDATPWTDYMEYFIPNEEDRFNTYRWCSTIIAEPSKKIHYGMLLISETQGVGKSTLGEKIMAPLVGTHNTSYPSEQTITDSTFNAWIAHKRLAVCHEIYAGHSSKAYDQMKQIITDRNINVNQKYQATYTIENWLHVIACSNSQRALKLDDNDRRWFVPGITTDKKPTPYWARLNAWLEDENGLGIIMQWMFDFCKKHKPIETGEPPPDSVQKRLTIEEGRSKGEQLVASALEMIRDEMEGKPEAKDCFVLDTQLVDLIKQKLYDGRPNDRVERPLTVRKVAKGLKWFTRNGEIGDAHFDSWGTAAQRSTVLYMNSDLMNKYSCKELHQLGLKPYDFSKLPEKM
jgi:hypothetical protein